MLLLHRTNNPDLTAYLQGEAPQLDTPHLSEARTIADIVSTGHLMRSLFEVIPTEPDTRLPYYGRAQKSIPTVIGESEGEEVVASLMLNTSHRFAHRIDERGRIRTARTILPTRTPAILGIGATVTIGDQDPIRAAASTQYSGFENIPGLDELRSNAGNQLTVEQNRVLFIASVVLAVQSAR